MPQDKRVKQFALLNEISTQLYELASPSLANHLKLPGIETKKLPNTIPKTYVPILLQATPEKLPKNKFTLHADMMHSYLKTNKTSILYESSGFIFNSEDTSLVEFLIELYKAYSNDSFEQLIIAIDKSAPIKALASIASIIDTIYKSIFTKIENISDNPLYQQFALSQIYFTFHQDILCFIANNDYIQQLNSIHKNTIDTILAYPTTRIHRILLIFENLHKLLIKYNDITEINTISNQNLNSYTSQLHDILNQSTPSQHEKNFIRFYIDKFKDFSQSFASFENDILSILDKLKDNSGQYKLTNMLIEYSNQLSKYLELYLKLQLCINQLTSIIKDELTVINPSIRSVLIQHTDNFNNFLNKQHTTICLLINSFNKLNAIEQILKPFVQLHDQYTCNYDKPYYIESEKQRIFELIKSTVNRIDSKQAEIAPEHLSTQHLDNNDYQTTLNPNLFKQSVDKPVEKSSINDMDNFDTTESKINCTTPPQHFSDHDSSSHTLLENSLKKHSLA
ncbi:MAG: hypothetical protein EP298_09220 [Gammaproteobacteria bacterium]|nr:MAG: hypothetical protein EP298_09220 [Gammaproteobacteria bacterium]UTW42338.1 hypothetical protein KFE69_12765 [bacterium SCSIO 12844]